MGAGRRSGAVVVGVIGTVAMIVAVAGVAVAATARVTVAAVTVPALETASVTQRLGV